MTSIGFKVHARRKCRLIGSSAGARGHALLDPFLGVAVKLGIGPGIVFAAHETSVFVERTGAGDEPRLVFAVGKNNAQSFMGKFRLKSCSY